MTSPFHVDCEHCIEGWCLRAVTETGMLLCYSARITGMCTIHPETRVLDLTEDRKAR